MRKVTIPLLLSVIIYLVVNFMASTEVSAQSLPKTTLSGYIFDESTSLPLPGVNVFLNNTTLGSATDKEGFFYIENVPIGTYELIVSMIGYEIEQRSVELIASTEQKLKRPMKLNTK